MPFLLGHPQLLFLEAEQDVAEIATIINTKNRTNFRFFMRSCLKYHRAGFVK